MAKRKQRDLTGQRFGKLTVLEPDPNPYIYPSGITAPKWICKCDCGNIVSARESLLLSGNTTSCGCSRRADLTGKRFGKLTVLELAGRRQYERSSLPLWLCQCDCGNKIVVMSSYLLKGYATSCGHCDQKTEEIKYPPKVGETYVCRRCGKPFVKLDTRQGYCPECRPPKKKPVQHHIGDTLICKSCHKPYVRVFRSQCYCDDCRQRRSQPTIIVENQREKRRLMTVRYPKGIYHDKSGFLVVVNHQYLGRTKTLVDALAILDKNNPTED